MAELHSQAFLDFLPVPVMVMAPNRDIVYINPAFENTYGWSLEEIRSQATDFIPNDQLFTTATGKLSLAKTGKLKNMETRRRTKDGRVLDVIYDGATFYDSNDEAAGLIITLRDRTETKRAQLTNQTLYRISNALHSHSELDDLLLFISHQTQVLLGAGRAHVMLLDEKQNAFYFRADAIEDAVPIANFIDRRFPLDYGIMGQVYRTGQPIIVNDYTGHPNAYQQNANQPDFPLAVTPKNMLQVPIWVEKKMIGILAVVNKKDGDFTKEDTALTSTIAGMVALPIENARINQQLHESYQEIQSLNKAKDYFIERLSHEVRTPLSVISASLHLLERHPELSGSDTASRILARCQRNLNRLMEIQYQMEDIVQNPDAQHVRAITEILALYTDQLESVVAEQAGEATAKDIRDKFDQLLGLKKAAAEKLLIGSFVEETVASIQTGLSHRRLSIDKAIADCGTICIPKHVLKTMIVGLVKNAVEYTPDGGRISISVVCEQDRAVLSVTDTGIGITDENQKLIFENFFTANDTNMYATRKPYEFNAGGGGFDLLRIKLFSGQYNFKIHTISRRCPFIPKETDQCPGDTTTCPHIAVPEACFINGGTTVRIEFPAETIACRL